MNAPVRIQNEDFSVDAELRALRDVSLRIGGIASFVGCARDFSEGRAVHEISFVPFFEDISVDYEEGSATPVRMHDGSTLVLRKLEASYDTTDKLEAIRTLHETMRRGEFATGIALGIVLMIIAFVVNLAASAFRRRSAA